MMTKVIWCAALTVSVFLLAGCGGSGEPEASPTVSVPAAANSTEATPTPTPTPTPKTNARDQTIKEVAEAGWVELEDGSINFKVKVTSVEIIKCDSTFPPEANGYPLAVEMQVETSADLSTNTSVNGQPNMLGLGPYNWIGYAENGTRMNTVESPVSQNCLADQSRMLPQHIGKAEKVSGVVILDVSDKSGQVAYEPWGPGAGGWIWEYPSKSS
ncbi:hypothetical protein [Arthrobacter pigmenti]